MPSRLQGCVILPTEEDSVSMRQTKQPMNKERQTAIKLEASGVMGGTDIQYFLTPSFYFLSTLAVGIVAGNQKLDSTAVTVSKGVPQLSLIRLNLGFSPMLEARFGIGWKHAFRKWALCLNAAYELASLLQHSAVVTTLSQGVPGTGETVIKTQVGLFEMQFVF